MDLTKCANGHIYDSAIYSSCPYCNNGNVVINFDNKSSKTEGYVEDGSTIPLDAQATVPVSPQPSATPHVQPRNAGQWDVPSPNQWAGVSQEPRGVLNSSGLGGKTEIIGRDSHGNIPVAGWLVCLKGKMRGKSYTLYCKQNTIGRDRNRDVVIMEDETISGHQANISYDMRHNTFTVVPKTETNTMYLNDEPIYQSEKIKEFDLIEMGRATFVFVPFCGERFTWKDEEKG